MPFHVYDGYIMNDAHANPCDSLNSNDSTFVVQWVRKNYRSTIITYIPMKIAKQPGTKLSTANQVLVVKQLGL